MRKSNRIPLPKVIEQVDPNSLRVPEDPIHKDDPLHVESIAGSIEQLDFVNPVLIGPNNEIIDGVQRVKAAIRHGCLTIPILRLDDVTANQVTAIRIALNKTQRGSRFSESALKGGISDLIGQGFDVLKLGFDAAEIDALFASTDAVTNDEIVGVESEGGVVTRCDDIFAAGPHVIACGDCPPITHSRSGLRPSMHPASAHRTQSSLPTALV